VKSLSNEGDIKFTFAVGCTSTMLSTQTAAGRLIMNTNGGKEQQQRRRRRRCVFLWTPTAV